LKVLKLSAQGLPQSWISLEQAVIHYAAEEVRWESGGQIARYRGGYNAVTGEQSVVTVNSIIGTKGVPGINPFELKPGLTNSKLFARDRNVCAYCGGHFHEEDLTREHIVPFATHGQDHWMNVVTACPLSLPNSSPLRSCKLKSHRKPRGCPKGKKLVVLTSLSHQFVWPQMTQGSCAGLVERNI
jgi:hypothetical protein